MLFIIDDDFNFDVINDDLILLCNAYEYNKIKTNYEKPQNNGIKNIENTTENTTENTINNNKKYAKYYTPCAYISSMDI